ncbi:MAG: 30S ribosomal protein S20 [Calditrichota bacterium]
MAHYKSAIKRIRTSDKARLRNRQYRSLLRLSLRRVREAENPEQQRESLRKACSVLDRLVGKGIIHRNLAARRKSRLSMMIAKQPALAQ